MNEFRRFGSPNLFEIAARWTGDSEPHERLPLVSGWSMGDIEITVGHQVLTARQFGASERSFISWYLHPVLDWFIQHWTWLLHEEVYSWVEKSGAPAAMASIAALGRTIGSSDEDEKKEYRTIHSWWTRHALRAADNSALYPDVCFRRIGDEIEISWTGRQPAYAPEELSLVLSPGYATLPVSAVAQPLWDFLQWALETAPVVAPADEQVISELKKRFQRLKQTPLKELESKYLHERLQALLSTSLKAVEWENSSTLIRDIPAVASLDAAVLMFGGLSPSIGKNDAIQLLRFLKRYQSQEESKVLLQMVDDRSLNAALAPYQDGYELAEYAREDLDISENHFPINVQRVLLDLGVSVEEVALETNSVRGVAVAGDNFSAAILVNTASPFNQTRDGRRFTMAHELCHILFDRTRAKRLSHVSGAWTSARVEKRANAFAAMFLASRLAVRRTFTGKSVEAISTQAHTLEIGYSALIEHLCNLDLIDEADRERLRNELGNAQAINPPGEGVQSRKQ
jgi:Zn-dependent peptidase ImmA (M78 family)